MNAQVTVKKQIGPESPLGVRIAGEWGRRSVKWTRIHRRPRSFALRVKLQSSFSSALIRVDGGSGLTLNIGRRATPLFCGEPHQYARLCWWWGAREKTGHKRLAANAHRCFDAYCSGVSPIEMLAIYPDLMHCISR